jgi:hypothetical protein
MTELDLDQRLRDLPRPAAPAFGGELEAALAGLQPVAPRRPLRQLAMLLGTAVIYGAAMVMITGVRRDLTELPIGWLCAYVGAWAVGFVGLAGIILVPPAGAMMPNWRVAGVGGVIAAIGFVTAGLLTAQAGASSVQLPLGELYRGHWCVEIGLITGLVPAAGCVIALRGALPVGARWAATGLGAASGCFAGLVLHLHCPIADPWHLGLIHGGVVVLSAALAAAIAPRRLALS